VGLLYVLLNHLYHTRENKPAKASRQIIQASLYKAPNLGVTVEQQILDAPRNNANLFAKPKPQRSAVIDKPNISQSFSGNQASINKPSSAEPVASHKASSKPTKPVGIVTKTIKSESVAQAPISSTFPSQKQRSAASYLESYQQQQLDKLATQRAKLFEQQKNAPVLAKPKKHKARLSAEQQFKQNLEIKVDCSNSAKRAATMAAGLFGGTLRCEPQAELQQFLDAKRQQLFDNEPKRPQRSLVIQP
jgi:hypothetical protein